MKKSIVIFTFIGIAFSLSAQESKPTLPEPGAAKIPKKQIQWVIDGAGYTRQSVVLKRLMMTKMSSSHNLSGHVMPGCL